MIVCSCHGLTDRDIRRAHAPGGPGRCEAGTGCGNCLPVVAAIAEQCRTERRRDQEFTTAPRAPRDGSDLAPRG